MVESFGISKSSSLKALSLVQEGRHRWQRTMERSRICRKYFFGRSMGYFLRTQRRKAFCQGAYFMPLCSTLVASRTFSLLSLFTSWKRLSTEFYFPRSEPRILDDFHQPFFSGPLRFGGGNIGHAFPQFYFYALHASYFFQFPLHTKSTVRAGQAFDFYFDKDPFCFRLILGT